MHEFEFNGKRLSELGACITESPHYSISMRDLSFVSIPGRSGDVIIDNDRYNNTQLSYSISSIPNDCITPQEFVYSLSEWLVSSHSYGILRDTYNTGYFRKAVVTEISNAVATLSGVVTATVTFTCDPFLYSDAGLKKHIFHSNDAGQLEIVMKNCEWWSSKPIIRIIGTNSYALTAMEGGFSTGDNEVDEITADSTTDEFYDGEGNSCSDKVSCLKMPVLKPGLNRILVSAAGNEAYDVEIVPNWRRL